MKNLRWSSWAKIRWSSFCRCIVCIVRICEWFDWMCLFVCGVVCVCLCVCALCAVYNFVRIHLEWIWVLGKYLIWPLRKTALQLWLSKSLTNANNMVRRIFLASLWIFHNVTATQIHKRNSENQLKIMPNDIYRSSNRIGDGKRKSKKQEIVPNNPVDCYRDIRWHF